MNDEELIKELKHNLVKFGKDYRRIFKACEDDNESHLSWSYETAIIGKNLWSRRNDQSGNAQIFMGQKSQRT